MTTMEPGTPSPSEPDGADLTELLREALREHVSSRKFDLWFASIQVERLDEVALVVSFDNKFQSDWNRTRHLDTLQQAALKAFGHELEIELTVRVLDPDLPSDAPPVLPTAVHKVATPTAADNAASNQAFMEQHSDFQLNDSYSLDNFVVGPSNQLAHAAGRAVADAPGGSYNPLYIHGPTGLGKTHLLQGICRNAFASGRSLKVRYLSSETFVNEFIAAIERNELDRFRYGYRSVDLLLIDDIHLLAHKERTQDEFFHTFNSLYNANKQIVLSSDSPPNEIPTVRERLSSRFSWGLVTEINPPRFETRLAILQRKARERDLTIDDEVLAFLAHRIERNIRELEGAITKVSGLAQLSGRPIDLDLARQALQQSGHQGGMQKAAPFDVILKVASGQFSVTGAEVLGRRRTQSVVQPRQVVMFLARKCTNMSYEEIGRHCGGRDHSTVLYAVRKIDKRVQSDPAFAQLMEDLEREILR